MKTETEIQTALNTIHEDAVEFMKTNGSKDPLFSKAATAASVLSWVLDAPSLFRPDMLRDK